MILSDYSLRPLDQPSPLTSPARTGYLGVARVLELQTTWRAFPWMAPSRSSRATFAPPEAVTQVSTKAKHLLRQYVAQMKADNSAAS
jgi:hypothetical protein